MNDNLNGKDKDMQEDSREDQIRQDAQEPVSKEELEIDAKLEQDGDEGAKRKVLLMVPYSLNIDDIMHCFNFAQRIKGYKIKIFENVALTIIFIGYLSAYIMDPTYTFGLVMTIASLVVLLAIWIVPYVQMRGDARKIVAKGSDMRLRLTDTGFTIYQNDKFTSMSYQEDVKFYEDEECFMLVIRQHRLFVLPKRTVEEGAQDQLREIMKEKLGSRVSDLRRHKKK